MKVGDRGIFALFQLFVAADFHRLGDAVEIRGERIQDMDVVGDRRRDAVREGFERVCLGLVSGCARERAGFAVGKKTVVHVARTGEVHGDQADLIGGPDEGKPHEILLDLIRGENGKLRLLFFVELVQPAVDVRVDLVVEVVVDIRRVLGFGFGSVGGGSAVKFFDFIRGRLAGDCRDAGGESGQEEDGLKFHKFILLLKLECVDYPLGSESRKSSSGSSGLILTSRMVHVTGAPPSVELTMRDG